MEKLLDAVGDGDVATVMQCLQDGANINAVDADGWTALGWASYQGNIAMMDLLIGQGADLNQLAGDDRISALMYAIQAEKLKAAGHLLSSGAQVDAMDSLGWTALMHAVSVDYVAGVKLLLEHGAQADLRRDADADSARELAESAEIIALLGKAH